MNLQLFKYYSPKYKDEWNLSFWEKESLFFQAPCKFNDPWDCKLPKLVIPRQKNTLKKFHEYLTMCHGEQYSQDIWVHLEKLGRAEQRGYYNDRFGETIEDLRARVGVFSTSCIPDSELLWAHYGYSHQGYCLQLGYNFAEYFKDPELSAFGLTIPVKYIAKRQKWKVGHYLENPDEYIYDLISYKSSAWLYEYEVRLLNIDNNGFFSFPRHWLKSIIVGLAADEGLKSKLAEAAAHFRIPIYGSSG